MSVKSNRQAGGFSAASSNTGVPPGPTGTSPSDTAGGTDKYLGKFSTTAYGPPWGGIQGNGVTANGTDLRPARKIYGVAVDPKVIPLGTFLHIQPNPFNWNGTFIAFDTGGAIKGNRIDFYDWRGRAKQRGWGVKTAQVYRANEPSSQMTPPNAEGGGLFPHISIPNPLSVVDEAAGAIVDFVKFLLSPKAIGDLLAKIVAYFLKLVFKAIWNYVIAPILHWHQRAVMWYFDNIMVHGERIKTAVSKGDPRSILDLPGVKAFWTFSFWATGYAILWAKVDGDRALTTEPHKTPLGSLIRSFGNTRARRKLVKPKDVKKKTPQKPTPQESTAKITKVRTLSVTRKRQVAVGGQGEPEVQTPDVTEGEE